MANQINIDIGAAANDGTGDPLRTAFNYVNLNFANVWATGLPNSNVQFNNNRVLTVNTNANLVLAPNGTGVVQSNVSILPNIDRVHNLGSAARKWNNLYAYYLNISELDVVSNLVVGGNLTVEGDTIQIGNIVTDTKTIQLSNTAVTANAANGSGITVGANDNIATFLYDSSANAWSTGNIIPSVSNVYSLGNATRQWNDLYVSNATIFMNNVPISLTAGNVLTVNSQPVLINDSNTSITTTGNITADYFFGDGSQLSNVGGNTGNIGFDNYNIYNTQGGGIIFSNFNYLTEEAETAWIEIPPGNSSDPLRIIQEQGNVLLGANTQAWTFDTTGVLTVPVAPSGASNQIKYGMGNLVVWNDGGVTIGEYNGTDYGTQGIRINPGIEGSADIVLPADPANVPVQVNNYSGNVRIQTGEGDQWTFDTNGSLNIPGSIVSTSTITIDNRAPGNSADINLYSADDILLQARDRTLGSGSEGGDINIFAGDSAEDGDASGGDVTIEAGRGGAANVDNGGSGGFVTIQAGAGGDASTQEGGLSARGGGSLTLSAGSAGSNMGNGDRGSNGGDVIINAGESTGNNSTGGDIRLNTGTGGDNALAGSLSINIPDSSQSPGGSWVFDGTGNLTGPGDIEIGTGDTGVQLRSNQTGTGFYASIANITNGLSAVVVTLNDVEFVEGDQGTVTITGVVGETEANGFWGWRAVEVDQIQLYTDGTWSTPVDGTTWSAYASGGLAVSSGYNNLDIQGGSVAIISGAGKYWSFAPNGTTIFPTLTVTRGDRTGTLTGQALVFGDSTQEAIISTPNGTSDINSSQRFVINPGAGYANTTGEGGDIYLYAGRGGDAGGSGGDIKIRGGLGPVDGWGGYIDITGGEADGNGHGGYIDIIGGQSGNAAGGYVRIIGGQGRNGAEANITGGTGSAGSGGAVNITGGTSSNGLAEYGNVNISSGASTWRFDNTGNLVLPQGGVINEGPSPSFLGNAVTITPANGSDADQQLKIYPTFVEGNHLHLTTGNLYNTEMYVGDDNLYVKLANTGNIQLQANDNVGNMQQWTFGTDGVLNLPYEGILQSTDDTVTLRSFNTTTGNANGVYLGTSGGLGFFDQAIGANWLEIFRSGTDPQIATTGNLFIRTDSTGTFPTWRFDKTGNLTTPGSIVTGSGSGGNISGANVITANVFVASGNITGANLIATANVLSNGYARLTGGFDESQASTAGLYLGYAGGTARIMFGTGNTSQTLEIDNDGGTLRFYKPGTTLASLTNSGNFSAVGNVTGANISTAGRVQVGNGSAGVPSYAFTSDGAIDTGFYWVSDGNIGVTNNGVQTAQFLPDGVFRQIPRTVGTLPSASSVGAGARAFCTDLNSTVFGNLAVGGGGTYMPVFSNGTNWYIG